jgi:anti-sigma factor RsiW
MNTGPVNMPPDDPTGPTPIEELVAYLDGELDDQRTEAVEAQIGLNPSVRQEAEALRRTWDLLDYLPRPQPRADFTNRTLSRLDLAELSRSAPRRPAPRPRARRWLVGAGVAAALVLAGLAGYTGRALLVPAKPAAPSLTADEEAQLLADLRVIDRLHEYQQVEDIEYLRGLADPDRFGDEGGR